MQVHFRTKVSGLANLASMELLLLIQRSTTACQPALGFGGAASTSWCLLVMQDFTVHDFALLSLHAKDPFRAGFQLARPFGEQIQVERLCHASSM